MIVNATLSNNRVGVAVILDAASIASNFVVPEVMASLSLSLSHFCFLLFFFFLSFKKITLQRLETEL